MTDGPSTPATPSAPLDELGERLDQGEPLERILLDQVGPDWQEVLRTCAVLPDFSEDRYRAILRTAPDGPEIADLLAHGLLERAARPGHYRIAEVLRFACWDSWWRDSAAPAGTAPMPLRHLALRLAGACAEADDEPGRLRHLAIAGELDPDTFRAAFYEADRRLDLAHCQDLVNAVTDPQVAPLLPPALGRTVAEARVRTRARALWRPAYHQSAGYYRRPRVEEPLRRLFTRPGSRLLRIHATGGSGKSMLLRWFMARYCQERPTPLPCAYLDFDDCDPALAVTHPWLLVLEAAAQLNEQLIDTPFDELLAIYREDLALLPRNRSRAAGARLTGRPTAAPERRVRMVGDFIAVLNETLRRQCTFAVLVLDTLEEVLLRDGARLDELTAVLDRLRTGVPDLRIVASGRYDLADALPLPARDLRLDHFSPAESDSYLREVREITDPELRRAIGESSDGLPYTLALFADLADDLTPEQIRSASGPGLLYAIDRVLERVHDDRLRWLLRYGVIPRRLSLRIVREVMLPHLREGIRGSGTADDPELDERPVMRFPIFLRAEPGFTDEADELPDLWAALTRYAGDAVWVGRDPLDPDGLVIDRTVRDPLRKLLADHTVSKLLNRDLAAYFARRASGAESPPEWVRWTVEEFYHRFSEDPEKGARAWARLFGEPDFGEPDLTLWQLADEVLALYTSDEVALPPDALARTLLLLSWAGPEAGPSTLTDHLVLMEMVESLPVDLVDREVRRAIELTLARLSLHLGGPAMARLRLDAAAADLDLAAPRAAAEYHRLTGAVALAEGRGDDAQEAFEHADRLLRPTGGEVAAETRADVARLLDAGWVGHAARWLPRLSAQTAPELYLRLLLAVGRPTEVLTAHALLDPTGRARTADLAALAALRLYRPAEVLALTDPSADGPPDPARLVGSQLTRAAAQVMLRVPVHEVAALTRHVSTEPLPKSTLTLLLLRTARLLDTAGASEEDVARLISRAGRLVGAALDATSSVPPEVLAERAWWPEEAPEESAVSAAERRAAAPPPTRVVWLLGALARANPVDDEALTGELIDALGPLGLPEARLVALERLHQLPRRLRIGLETAGRLTELCIPDRWWTDSPDSAALGLTYAELLSTLGRTREAADLSRTCAEELARTESAVWLDHLERTAPEDRDPDGVPMDLADTLRRQYGAFPEAEAAALTEQAAPTLWAGRATEARSLATRAWQLLEDRPPSLTRARCAGVLVLVQGWAGGPRAEIDQLARRARELYRELGRAPEPRFLPSAAVGTEEPDRGVSWREHVLAFAGDTRFARLPAFLSLELLESTGPGERRPLVLGQAATAEWIRDLEALQSALSGSAADWAAEAGTLLEAVLPDRTWPEEVTDLRLEAAAGHEVLLAAPWEAAGSAAGGPVLRPDRHYVYRGLARHPVEPAALDRLRDLAESIPDLPPPTDLRAFAANLWGLTPPARIRVGVLARHRVGGATEHTGGRSSMSHILALYDNNRSAQVVDLDRRNDRRSLPQLVHVQGTFREESAELRIQWDSRGVSDAAGLEEWLGDSTGPHPVVVLEATHPGSHHEAMRQLLLRNLFAAQLLAHGEVSAVLAIGPFLRPGPDSERARRQFVEHLIAGVHPAVAVQELTKALLNQPGPPTVALPALFSALPTDLLVPLWNRS
ncbi:hypothetical protein ACFP3U_32805 [Kitasatospora misakiensis]|uniref:Orc1-like AAA ATPase domain-containing protein n=1 Tax=Kitasatospora misakiensis TaxID=67330 RepID=A0ABW0XBF2_9ACTN